MDLLVVRTTEMAPAAWTSVILLVCVYALAWLARTKQSPLSVPEVDCRGMSGVRQKLQTAYEKYGRRGIVYKVRLSAHDSIMLPPKFMAEVKSLPEDQVSFAKEVYSRFNGRWTGLSDGRQNDAFVHTVSRDLTRHTGTVIHEIVNECKDYAIPHEIGTSTEWTALPCLHKSLRIVALLTSRTFMGLPASRDEEWIATIIGHTRKVFGAGMDLWKYPRPIRSLIAPFIKGVRELGHDREIVKGFVRPRVEERIAESNQGQPPPDDILQWLMKNEPERKADVEWHARQQLSLSIASIHTTGMLLAHCLFALSTHSNYQAILRSELVDTLEKDGSRVVRKQTITKLRKLDSFVREVIRFSPPSLTSMNRLVTARQGIRLSNGVLIPNGTYISVPSAQVAMDSSLWHDPEKFDGLRFSDLRETPVNDNKYQLVSVNDESIAFGSGKHSCPGRFFASNEIKLVIMHMVLNYDMKLETDGKPESLYTGTSVTPDPVAKIMFRKRENDVELLEPDKE